MRGPGAVPGLYAIESAMNELALKLNMDPVELHLRNEPKLDESTGLPFSSRHLIECLRTGAEKFGWSKRTPEVGSMKRDGLTLGWGVAACGSPPADCAVSVDLRADGTARVVCGTQDIGTGTYTMLAQLVAEQTGLPLDKIEVVSATRRCRRADFGRLGGDGIGDSPCSRRASGRQVVHRAPVRTRASPFNGAKPKSSRSARAACIAKTGADSGVPFDEILEAAKMQRRRAAAARRAASTIREERNFRSTRTARTSPK